MSKRYSSLCPYRCNLKACAADIRACSGQLFLVNLVCSFLSKRLDSSSLATRTHLSKVVNVFVLDGLLVSRPLRQNLSSVRFRDESVVFAPILRLVLGKHQPALLHPGLQGLAQHEGCLLLRVSHRWVFQGLLKCPVN